MALPRVGGFFAGRATPWRSVAVQSPCFSTSAPSSPVLTEADGGVLTLTMNNPKRYNAWTEKMMLALQGALDDAAEDNTTRVVVLTGTDPYYCAGVDLASVIKPMHPKELYELIRSKNEQLFEMFLKFPKPIIAAINGPAIGASVTSSTLCDAVVAADVATLSTPFAKLGVPPEGCSSIVFDRRMGAATAQRMLGDEGWAPTAAEAKAAGFHPEMLVVPREDLLPAARGLAAEWIEDGRAAEGVPRELHARDGGTALAELRETNARESADLAHAFLSHKFLANQRDFLSSKKKSGPALMFRVLAAAAEHNVWTRLAGVDQ